MKMQNMAVLPLTVLAYSCDSGQRVERFNSELLETGQESTGTCASVWVCEDGDWKWVLDTGNQGTGE